jgi:hypothetical protein
MSTPWFFDRLGVAPTRDARQIKRAYALALKAIDQQAEREAFETLREAYEAALAWARTPGEQEPDAPAVGAVPPGVPASGRIVIAPPAWDPPASEPAGLEPTVSETMDSEPPTSEPPASEPPASEPPASEPAASAPPDMRRPPPGDPAAAAMRTVISNETYGTSRIAMRQWMSRLLDPQDTPVADVLDQALNDPRLVHLDSRVQLEAQIIEALYRASAGRAELFDAAAARFGWGDRNARPAGNAHQAEWISRVINQQLMWTSIDDARLAAQRAAIAAARLTDTPTRKQAFAHAPALQEFDRGFPEWSELNLPAGRAAAWQAVYDQLSEGWIRAATMRQRYPSLLRIASTVLLVIILGVTIRSMMLPPSIEGLNAAQQKERRDAADKSRAAAGQTLPPDGPVLAFEITGPITLDSCYSTHEFIHESNWLDVGDADAVTLLSSRAMLCRQRQYWPQADDPVLDCLRTERIAALSANRPDAPGHCRDKPAAGGGRDPGRTSAR